MDRDNWVVLVTDGEVLIPVGDETGTPFSSKDTAHVAARLNGHTHYLVVPLRPITNVVPSEIAHG